MLCFPILLLVLLQPLGDADTEVRHVAREIDIGRVAPMEESEFVIETSFPFTEPRKIQSLKGSCGCTNVTLLSDPVVEPNSTIRFQMKLRPSQQSWETRGVNVYFVFEPSNEAGSAVAVQPMRYQPSAEFAFMVEPVFLGVDPLDEGSRVFHVGNFGAEKVTRAFVRLKSATGVEHIVTAELTEETSAAYPRQVIPFKLATMLAEGLIASSKESEISVHVATNQEGLFRKVLDGKLVVEAVSSVKVIPEVLFQPPEGSLTLNLFSPNSAINLADTAIELLDSASTEIPFEKVVVKGAWVRVRVDSVQLKHHASSRKSQFRFKLVDKKGVEHYVPFTFIGDHEDKIP